MSRLGTTTYQINERVKAAVALLRATRGTVFLRMPDLPWKEHVGPNDDFHLGYRSYEEARPWVEGDQLGRLGALIGSESRERIEAQVKDEIRVAIAWAEEEPFPEARELLTDITGD
jgi:TPP-dependent pyruvate/acetoin dehydrogenase alpha subunit